MVNKNGMCIALLAAFFIHMLLAFITEPKSPLACIMQYSAFIIIDVGIWYAWMLEKWGLRFALRFMTKGKYCSYRNR